MDTLYHRHMTQIYQTPLETIQAEQFDECFRELSPEAQDYFKWAIAKIMDNLATGAGEKSAKALLVAIATNGNYKSNKQEKNHEMQTV